MIYWIKMTIDEVSGLEVPRRGRPPSLTKDQIVAAALKLTDESSLEEVSMRAVAAELGVPVMTIYNYVPSKEVLNELVVDHVLRSVELPSPETGTWDHRMRQLQRAARGAMRRHPGLSFSRHGSGSQEAKRLAEGAMSILRDGGFAPIQATTAFATLFTFMLGQVELDVLADSASEGEATFESMTTGLGLSRDQLFEIGLDAVIVGITATKGISTNNS